LLRKLIADLTVIIIQKNEEIITIPNLGQVNDEEEFQDAFSAELKKVKQNKAEFIKLGFRKLSIV